jgi:NADH:ubiquinone oxidoreductase subunit F (NADH-binding)
MNAPLLPRLLAAAGSGRALGFAEHVERQGALATVAMHGEALLDAVAASGLRGRGGAAFPTAVKLRAVAARRGPRALVVNGAEGEPLSAKDRLLLETAPHLVIDGALLAAEAVRARDVVVAVKRSAWSAHEAVARALAERRDTRGVALETVPDAYIAGEETALVHALDGGPTKPTPTPPRPFERGLGRRPTLIANVETLAHLALIARRGPAWFRELGTDDHPGSALVTVAGAVQRPVVHEIGLGTPLADVLHAAGQREPLRAVLVGGYYGTWLTPTAAAAARLDDAALRAHGAALGAGVLLALPSSACPAAEVARVARWMAGESSGQCGPCVHGLDAIAGAVEAMASGTGGPETARRVERWAGQVDGRGACHHPNGAVRFVRSALSAFADELEDHRRHGPCDACDAPAVLRIPRATRRLAA